MPRKPLNEEKRESRLNLLLTSSLYRDVVMLADSQGISSNELIVRLLEKFVKKNSALIERFRTARENAQKEFDESI